MFENIKNLETKPKIACFLLLSIVEKTILVNYFKKYCLKVRGILNFCEM